MVTVKDKALNYAKKTGLSFVVKTIAVNLSCWDGSTNQALSIKAKAVHESEVEDYLYNEFEVSGVKVFIAKELKMGEEVVIFQHPQLPFSKPSFGVTGVSIQH